MGGRSHHAEFNAHLVPVISALDAYTAGDAFGAAIDLTPYVSTIIIKPEGQSQWHTFIEISSVGVSDLDDQQASYDVYFKCEDFNVDIPDNDPFNPSSTDLIGLSPVIMLPASGNYRELPPGGTQAKGSWEPSFTKIPLQGSKLWAKIVIQDAKTFTGIDRVTFDLIGFIN